MMVRILGKESLVTDKLFRSILDQVGAHARLPSGAYSSLTTGRDRAD
jgi:hypothetical protein